MGPRIGLHREVDAPAERELVEGKYAPYNGITPYEERNPMSYTFLGVEISPTLFAIGWFMKFRAALLVNLGQSSHGSGLFPLQCFRTSLYDPEQGVYRDITEMGPIVQWQAFGSIIRTVAIGAILGGGFLGLFKMAPTFIGIFGDITQAF